jgi:phosphonate transport system ATP-binding protein
MNKLEARSLSKILAGGHRAVEEFSATIERGERVAIVGANGAGKSTALRLLNLSLRPTTGALLWNGADTAAMNATELRAVRSRIGTVPQRYDLIPQLSVRANVLSGRFGRQSLFGSFRSVLGDRDTGDVERVLSLVGVAPLIDERSDRLSGGEQQRVAIARALYQEPYLLCADEPLAAVDPASSAKLMEMLISACEATGCALLMTSHQLELVRDYFPRVIGMRAGRVFFDLPRASLTEEVLSSLYATR